MLWFVSTQSRSLLLCWNQQSTSLSLSSPPPSPFFFADSINIKILNAGAWARGNERVTVSLPLELEDYIPEVEDFYKKKHSGRKLQWYHHMSNGTVCIVCRMCFVMIMILCCKVLFVHLETCPSTS